MRYTLINGLLMLALSPFSALALPVDPSNEPGQWDPSGHYDKGRWENGQFISNNQNLQNGQWNNGQNYQNSQYNNGRWQRRSVPQPFGASPVGGAPGVYARNWPWDQNNQNGQGWTDQNGQWHPNNQNGQGWTDQNGQWHPNNQNGQGWTDQNGQWHANKKRVVDPDRRAVDPAALNNGGLTPTGTVNNPNAANPNLAAPGIHARNWPWDQNNQNGQGWTDANGQWHPNNQNQNGQGWTDANGQWHPNNQNGQGWTDGNGQWHPSKREWRDDGYGREDGYNRGDGYNNYNDGYRDDRYNNNGLDRAADRAADDILGGPVRRWWPFNNWNNRNGDRNRYNDESYRDQCQGKDWRACGNDIYGSRATPTPGVGNNYNQGYNNNYNGNYNGNNWNRPSATPVAQNGYYKH